MAICGGICVGALAIGAGVLMGGGGIGIAANQTGEAADKSADLAKWLVIGGGLYVSYRALKSAGAIR